MARTIKPFKRQVHVGDEIWTYKIGVLNSVILTPKGDKKIVVSHETIAGGKSNYEKEHHTRKVGYIINPKNIRQYIENNISSLILGKNNSPVKSKSITLNNITPKTNAKIKQKTFGIKIEARPVLYLNSIKTIKDLFGLGLKESKDILDNIPYIIRNIDTEKMNHIHHELAKTGIKYSLIT